MDEEELDAWYDEQKEKLTERYGQKIAKSKNKEEVKKEYLKNMDALHASFERKAQSIIKHNLAAHFRKHRWEMFKERMMKPFEAFLDKFKKKKKET